MSANYSNLLQGAALRVTAARLAVLKYLDKHPHSDADQVKEGVVAELGSVSGQAVYDALNTLCAAQVLRRIAPAGMRSTYEIDTGDNHHHLVCRSCKQMLEVPCAKGERPCLDPCDDHGFVIDEAEVIYWGYCPRCARTQGLVGPTS